MIPTYNEYMIMLFRFFLAAVLGGIVGLERDVHGRDAGVRTHLLVSAGSALFTIISLHISDITCSERADLGRIAAQIVSGIGFLGAGTIIRDGMTVRGLTSAACLWVAAALGMTAGVGYYGLSVAATMLTVFSLIVLKKTEQRVSRAHLIHLQVTVASLNDLDEIRKFLTNTKNIKMGELALKSSSGTTAVEADITMQIYTKKHQAELTSELAQCLQLEKEKILSFSLNCND